MRAVPLIVTSTVLWLLACEGSHTDLAVDSTSTSTGGSAPIGGSGGGDGGAANGGAPPIVEPDGPSRLTVLHAIADRPSMQLCLLESPANANDPSEPWPSAPLEYARTAIASDLPGSLLPSSADVEILVLTGDLDEIGAATCRDVADDPAAFAGVETLSLGVTPTSTFTMPRSLLLAVNGCFGGETHDGKDLEPICGPGYTPDTPTPGVVVAPLSRFTTPTTIGFQVVNALSSRSTVDGFVRPSFDGVLESPISYMVVSGAALPFPPSTLLTASELGSIEAAVARISVVGSQASEEITLGAAIENGGVSSAVFANGRNVALVAVGPSPTSPVEPWANDFTVVVVDPDPSER